MASILFFSASVLGQQPGTVIGWGYLPELNQIPAGLSNAISVQTSGNHALALRADGTVTAWGSGGDPYGIATVPPGLSNVIAIATGGDNDLALLSNGTVFQWGSPYIGAVPASLSHVTEIGVGELFGVALKNDGTVVGWGSMTIPTGLTNISHIAVRYGHVIALKTDGTVVCWGSDDAGQSSPPIGLSNVIAVAAGQTHSLALKQDSTVVCWGNNNYGQRTPPPGLSGVVQIFGGYDYSLALQQDGTLVGWGYNGWLDLNFPPGLTNIISLAGDYNVFAMIQLDHSHQPTLYVGSNRFHEGNQSNDVSITATLLAPYAKPVSVTFSTTDGTAIAGRDYISNSGTLIFPPNTTTQKFSITILGDLLHQPDRTFFINLFNPTNATLVATQVVQTIQDDDTLLLPTGFSALQIATNLSLPSSMDFAPDGRLFVCEQGGNLRIIKNGTLLPTPFLQVATSDSDWAESGLLGVAFDRGFLTNQFVYIYYTALTPYLHNRVSRFVANGDVAVTGSEQVILDLDQISNASVHNAGAIHFGPDGKLFVAVGDNQVGSNAQSMTNRLGKILRINSDGTIPSDNPFYLTATAANRSIWAIGFRNPFSFAFQPDTGRMLINDVGENTWEEIDEGQPGADYGWPAAEGPSNTVAFHAPLFSYGHNPACAIVGAAFYNPGRATFPPDYWNNYFYADYCGGWIHRLNDTNNALPFAQGVSFPVDLKVGPDGAIYCLSLTARPIGRVLRFDYDRNSRFTSIDFLPDGRIKLGVGGSLDHTFVLQVSTDLVDWQPIATNTFTVGTLDIYDTPSTAIQYYRVAE